jgi:hypothetical protein
MSFREKTAWVTMIAIIAVSLMYWFHMPVPFEPHPTLHVVHAVGASVVAYLLIEVIAWLVLRWRYPRDAREPVDEREKLIDLKAIRVAYYVFAVAAFAGMFITLHLAAAGPVAIAMTTLMAFLLSQVVKHAVRIICFRRGF